MIYRETNLCPNLDGNRLSIQFAWLKLRPPDRIDCRGIEIVPEALNCTNGCRGAVGCDNQEQNADALKARPGGISWVGGRRGMGERGRRDLIPNEIAPIAVRDLMIGAIVWGCLLRPNSGGAECQKIQNPSCCFHALPRSKSKSSQPYHTALKFRSKMCAGFAYNFHSLWQNEIKEKQWTCLAQERRNSTHHAITPLPKATPTPLYTVKL